MRAQKYYVLMIYFVCTFLFFMLTPNTMINSEEVFKNIYWAIFYLLLFYVFVAKLPNYQLILNRYGKLDHFFKSRVIYLLIQSLVFAVVLNMINLAIMLILGRMFSFAGLLNHLYHLFFILFNYALISLILDFFVPMEFRWVGLLVIIASFIFDALLGSGPLGYFGLTASYSQYGSGSLFIAGIKYMAYIALWIFIYLMFISNRKEIT